MTKNEIESKKAIKYLPLFYIGLAIIFVLIAYAVNFTITVPDKDLYNATALVIEVGIGIAITWTVYVYSKKMDTENKIQQQQISLLLTETKNQQNKISSLVSNIERIEKDQQEILENQILFTERRKEYAYRNLLDTVGILKKILQKLKAGITTEEVERNEDGETITFEWYTLSKVYANELEPTLDQYSDVVDPTIRNNVKNISNVVKPKDRWYKGYDELTELIDQTIGLIERVSGLHRGEPGIFYKGLDGETHRAI